MRIESGKEGPEKATSETQKRASAKYTKEKVKQLAFRFPPTRLDLFDHIKSQPSIAGYIKRLVREDMEKGPGA